VAPLLSLVPPFDRYPADVLDHLGRYADRLRVPEGTVIAHRGWQAREAVAVLSGTVYALADDAPAPGEHTRRPGRAQAGGRAGDGTGAAATAAAPGRAFGPGSWLGCHQIVADEPHAATLVAGPGLEVVVVTGPAYRWAAGHLPGLADDTA
jgi:hypothetical protein